MVDFSIVGRDVPVSEFMWNAVYDHVSRLDKFYERIVHCDVAISTPHRHHHKGKVYHIRVHLQVPGRDIIVSREPEKNAEHEDFYLALNDIFKVTTRKLQDHVRRLRYEGKSHIERSLGVVTRLFPEEGYGFLQTSDFREIYFHKNSVIGGRFDSIRIGSQVHFNEEMGLKGPQASSVYVGR